MMLASHTAAMNRLAGPQPGQLRVAIAGRLTALVAPGGGEVQMLETERALREVGVRASLWRPWEEPLTGFDCLHLFGSTREHLPLVAAARAAGLRTVLSPITWFDLGNCWREPGAIRRVAACTKYLARAACPQLPSWRRSLYHAVDLLLPNSNAEAGQLMRHFGVPASRIRVVPNAADARFAMPAQRPLPAEIAAPGYVLYAGRIEPRKNQLTFLKAMHGSGARAVILGDPVPGHEAYYAACREAADSSTAFLPALPHTDPRLESLYAHAGALALASWFETPGLVAIEAGMSGVPLVLTSIGSAAEYFGELAAYVHPRDQAGLRSAVLAALERGRSAELAQHISAHFTWHAAAEHTGAAYVSLA